MGQKLLDHAHRATQIDVDLAGDIFQGAVGVYVEVAHDAGVVDEDVERGEGEADALLQGGDGRCIADVALKGMEAGERAPCLIETVLFAARYDDYVVSRKELSRQLKADAAGAACDKNRSLRQSYGNLL